MIACHSLEDKHTVSVIVVFKQLACVDFESKVLFNTVEQQ